MKSRWIAVSLLSTLVSLGSVAAAAPHAHRLPELRPGPAQHRDPETRKSPAERPTQAAETKRHGGSTRSSEAKPQKERERPAEKTKHGKGKKETQSASRAERSEIHRRTANDAVHARRLAQLERMRTTALDSKDAEAIQHVDKLVTLENARYQRALDKLDARQSKAHGRGRS